MDPDQTERMRRLVWIHAGRKRWVFDVCFVIYKNFNLK
jgi:hypothetical protein